MEICKKKVGGGWRRECERYLFLTFLIPGDQTLEMIYVVVVN